MGAICPGHGGLGQDRRGQEPRSRNDLRILSKMKPKHCFYCVLERGRNAEAQQNINTQIPPVMLTALPGPSHRLLAMSTPSIRIGHQKRGREGSD